LSTIEHSRAGSIAFHPNEASCGTAAEPTGGLRVDALPLEATSRYYLWRWLHHAIYMHCCCFLVAISASFNVVLRQVLDNVAPHALIENFRLPPRATKIICNSYRSIEPYVMDLLFCCIALNCMLVESAAMHDRMARIGHQETMRTVVPSIQYYSDGRHPSIYMYEPPMQREELCHVVDELAGTPVQVTSLAAA